MPLIRCPQLICRVLILYATFRQSIRDPFHRRFRYCTLYLFTFSINGNLDSVIVSPNNSDTAILSFSDTGLYVVVLKSVHDSSSTLCAKTLSDTALLLIKPLPKASMTVSDSTVCQGDPSVVVHFSGSGATPPYTFTFNVDNGPDQQIVSDTLGNAYDTLSTATAGTFYYHLVSVKDSSSSACSNTQVDTLSIAINPLPTAYLSGSDTLCYSGNPSEILFIGDSGTAPYTFTFSINGNDSVIVSPNNSDTAILSFSDTGLYVVVLKSVHDSSSTLCAKTLSDTALLLIKPLPKASMTVSDSTVCQGDPSVVVHFSGSGATPPYTFTFNVDNGPDQQIVSDTLGNDTHGDTLSTATAGTFFTTTWSRLKTLRLLHALTRRSIP
ncbi:MAG: hypothetical protein H6605_08610 [Flavobacteriales bacterium]|nr:hypothetical protein [Flavobacteriales bacterium]